MFTLSNQKKQAKMQCLQDQNQINVDNLKVKYMKTVDISGTKRKNF